jgi:predicted DNA-binding transcriptional regulator YafY
MNEQIDQEKLDLIRTAILQNKVILFDYVSHKIKVSTDRKIKPVSIEYWHDKYTKVWGHDEDADGILKQFELIGMMNVRIGGEEHA